ncbi:hypothetical protein D3C81_2022240 [compost metagenome]
MQRDHGDDGDQDVLQHMHADDAAIAQTLGARKLDVVLQQRFLCTGARQADHQCNIEQRQIEGRQQQMLQAIPAQEADRDTEQ